MTTPLLTTKLYIQPLRPELVSRPRLIERLNEGLRLGRKLTLISAPAGFGKTTLLSSWSAACEPRKRVAWVSLDDGDNDPARFMAYVVAALQTIQETIGETVVAVLQSPQPLPVEAVLTGLINEIAEVPEPFVLVLDDYHAIHAAAIHDALSFLVDHLPSQMHLAIATRADPPLPIPRLRGRGWLNELYQSDLRFRSEEIAQFLHLVMGLKLSAEDVAALERRTEGWIAGLQMAALSMRGRDDMPGFVRAFTGSHRYILDYLSEEVLRGQSREVQTFLLQTAILDRLSGELCDAVIEASGPGESQSVLEYLERSNLFVVPLDDERRWYRYHHLFADLLRQRLQRERRGLAPELHRRASTWYEQEGILFEAVNHALPAGDFEQAAELVEQAAQTATARGELVTLRGWLQALPDTVVHARPRLCLAHAWTLLVNEQHEMAEARLKETESACQALASQLQGLERQALLGEVTVIRANIARFQEDLPRAIELSRHALEQLPEANLFLRGLAAANLGIVYRYRGDVQAAHQAYTEAWSISEQTHHVVTAVLALQGLAQLEVLKGHLRQAHAILQQALQFVAHRYGGRLLRVPAIGIVHIYMGELLREWNDLENAARYLLEGIELGKPFGAVLLVEGYVSLARVRLAQGDRDSAEDALQQAEQHAHRSKRVRSLSQVAGCRTRLWLSPDRSNVSAAARWAQESLDHLEDELGYLRQAEYLALVRVFINLGKTDQALQLVARLQRAAEAAGRMGEVIEMLSLQALAYQSQGDEVRAMATLEQAISLAKPEGYVRTFIDEGESMARLLRQMLSRGIASNYVARLLAVFGEKDDSTSPAIDSLIEPLTERELEVLRLIVAGLSNPEIAQELVIAVSTVKSHVNHIYGKLGVKNRVEAVARTRALSLL
jgi:LuxR family maltose regulon positive regulatory protein